MINPKDLSRPSEATEDHLTNLQKGTPGYTYDWVSKLDKHFFKHGLLETKVERHQPNPAYSQFHNLNFLLATEESAVASSSPDADKAKALQEQLTNAYAEMREGTCTAVDYVVAVGKKPQRRWAANFVMLISPRSQFYASH
ncbi:hypothetical protein MMC13_003626 [Lambiella insularis]|nr:hypothetical protein [Lambiella insularis]